MKVEFVLFGVVLRFVLAVEPRYAVFVGRDGSEERVCSCWTYKRAVDMCVETVKARSAENCGECFFGFVRDVTSRCADFTTNAYYAPEVEMRLFLSRSDQ